MKDGGALHFFLSMEVHYRHPGILLSQSKYALDLLHQFGMDGAKPIATPTCGDRLSISDGDPLHDPTEYRRLVGNLQYLSLTRPNIAYAVNSVCQFMHSPAHLILSVGC